MKLTIRLLSILLSLFAYGCGEAPSIDLQSADYTGSQIDPSCASSRDDKLLDVAASPEQLGYALRAPQNFKLSVRHPLLVVFPAAGQNSLQSERFTRFTEPATARGLVVLYPAHRRLSLRQIDRLQALVEDVASQWCIDHERIFFTGHSDGGTVTHVLAQRNELTFKPAKIAPSAAGIREPDLNELGCNAQLSVMLMHGENDELFPGYGESALNWWRTCNDCKAQPVVRQNGCEVNASCARGSTVIYCESSGGHSRWPRSRRQIIDFFLE